MLQIAAGTETSASEQQRRSSPLQSPQGIAKAEEILEPNANPETPARSPPPAPSRDRSLSALKLAP
jgi:hypothetical protein